MRSVAHAHQLHSALVGMPMLKMHAILVLLTGQKRCTHASVDNLPHIKVHMHMNSTTFCVVLGQRCKPMLTVITSCERESFPASTSAYKYTHLLLTCGCSKLKLPDWFATLRQQVSRALLQILGSTVLAAMCRSFDPQMGTTGRVLWVALPELLHVGAVICTAAVMVGVMGNTLFGFRAQAVSSLTCKPQLSLC